MNLDRERVLLSESKDPVMDLVKWVVRILVGVYVAIIFFTMVGVLLDKSASIEIIGSITGLLTTAIGGLLTAVFKRRRS